MKKYIVISNEGAIDTKAFQLIGASTKANDDSKIGEFGSGANYALAWLLRNDVEFHIYTGDKEIPFGKQVTELRGQTFETITVDGHNTGFTVTMGKGWEAWWVIREFWCNALDEGDPMVHVVEGEQVKSKWHSAGRTTVVIELNKELQAAYDKWSEYFVDHSKMRYEAAGVRLFPGGAKTIIYRKGIQVYSSDTPSVFHYDFDHIDINESRVIKSDGGFKMDLTSWWARSAPKQAIRFLMENMKKEHYETNLYWQYYDHALSDEWGAAADGRSVVERELAGHFVDDIVRDSPFVLPASLVEGLVKNADIEHVAGVTGASGVKLREATEQERFMLKKAQEFFKECEYEVKHEIKLCDFDKPSTIGLALDGKIYVCSRAFESMHMLVTTLIEEEEHLLTGLDDCSRAFQQHFINKFVDEKCKRFAYVL